MFTVNHQTNRISPVRAKKFSELGFSERKHLQEWLAHEPSALGEELLIIQKEFDGFDDTRERLDLLALDKDGNLVIIENKLDDSGRDVVWQTLKYASYCASLTKAQIVEIYQQYLDRYQPVTREVDPLNVPQVAELNASQRICEFLDAPDLDEVKLNLGNSQRIMLVAANFRKEVTSTALWLLGQGISIACFKITPYSLGEQLLINIDQIIPTPEAKELMIGINAKEAEEKTTEVVLKNRHTVRREYWERALEAFQKSSCDLYDNISTSKDHWLCAGSGVTGCPFSLIFNQKELRVELWLSRANSEENKWLFDELVKQRSQIDAAFGEPLEWLRLDDKKQSRIQYSIRVDGFNRDTWTQSVAWHLAQMTKLEKALKGPLQKAAEALKNKPVEV
ncbi:membrane protein [Vibrio cholerae]|nr:membrane protein [Vibrio cholerae]